jgi:hypothetical protein
MPKATHDTTPTSAATPTRRGKLAARGAATLPPLPPVPPPSAEEQAASASITAQLLALTERLHQRNLDSAVRLAILAANRQLPVGLEEHFGELGRRYSEIAGNGAEQRATNPRPRLAVNNGVEVAR